MGIIGWAFLGRMNWGRGGYSSHGKKILFLFLELGGSHTFIYSLFYIFKTKK